MIISCVGFEVYKFSEPPLNIFIPPCHIKWSFPEMVTFSRWWPLVRVFHVDRGFRRWPDVILGCPASSWGVRATPSWGVRRHCVVPGPTSGVTAITKRENTGSRLFTKVKPCWTRLISGWVTIEIKYPVPYSLGNQAGEVDINHAFHLYYNVVGGSNFSRSHPDFQGFLRALRFLSSAKLNSSLIQYAGPHGYQYSVLKSYPGEIFELLLIFISVLCELRMYKWSEDVIIAVVIAIEAIAN